MNYKKILGFLVLIGLMIAGAFAADFYESYRISYSNEKPGSMAILPYVCNDVSCSSASAINIELFKGDAISCWYDFGQNGDTNGYLSCLENYRISGNIVDLNDCSVLSDSCSGSPYVFVKYDTITPFGYNTFFYSSGDTYAPYQQRTTSFSCQNDICVNILPNNVLFGKVATAHAEIQQLNIVNIDNELLPVQVTVPVKIDETVCSAFRFANSNMFKPQPPVGFSDYSANTQVTLTITNANTNTQYLTQSINIPIEADTCAGLAAFSWTPLAGLEEEQVKFRVDTNVIDNQVITSIPDWAEVTETMYPINLDGTCWTRGYDFTLSNSPTFDLTTSIAQISEGERLYAGLNGGAYRDNTITPMNFNAYFYFNNTLVHTAMLSSNTNLQNYFVDLSSHISGLSAGSYNVTLVTIPIGAACIMSSSVIQTQNLQILAPETNTVTFYVRDSNYAPLSNANINLLLTSADDYYQTTPSYNLNLNTNAQGVATFSGAYSGNYDYIVSKANYTTVSASVHIASNTQIYITLPNTNQAPIVNLPTEMTQYYFDVATIDLREYITDYNDLYSSLLVSYNIVSGVGFTSYNNGILTVSTNTANDVVIQVSAVDPQGLSGQDTITIHFVDNQAPIVTVFNAEPDNGAVNFTTNFRVSVFDADADSLTCTLEFGDGTQTSGLCNTLDNTAHTYTNVGTFNAILRVSDGITGEFTAVEQVFVFQRIYLSPQIEYFNLTSSNTIYTPTNITLNWNVVHPDNLAMTCTLRINAVNYGVSCANGIYNLNNYNLTGNTRFTLIAFDGTNQDLRSIDLMLYNPLSSGPIVNYFTLTTQTGNFLLPNNLTLSYGVTHPNNLPMTCSVSVNGAVTPVTCTPAGTFNVLNFNVTGTSTFIFTATDGVATNNGTINQMFVSGNNTTNTVDLTLDLVDLQINDVIVPGEFEFGVSIMNETLNSRELKFKPMVSCSGVTLEIANNQNGFIDSSLISKVQRVEGFVYNFKLNTLDFTGLIPLDSSCRFMLQVTDSYGTNIVVTKAVMFSYPEEERQLQSIRGKGTDIANFMSTALGSELKTGYNAIQFKISNNELVDKTIEISMISQGLNIAITEEINLGSGQERSITLPLYVEENMASGSYPVRFSVSDGQDKQVRYTYIVVNN